MRILVKIGGTLLDAPASGASATRRSLAKQIAACLASGHECVVVHGGGTQMTRFLEERGIASRFVDGLRVTTPETMDAVLKVLAGSVNQELVSALIQEGARAVGLTGLDANLVEAVQMNPALGAVGRVTRCNPALLDLLSENRFLPVVACLAGDRDGTFYNVNADQLAVACASGFRAQRLVFLTDVPGVLDGSGQLLPYLTVSAIRELIATGVAKGGMQAKLSAATAALEQGIEEVAIVPGAEPDILRRILSGEAIGTRVAQEALAA